MESNLDPSRSPFYSSGNSDGDSYQSISKIMGKLDLTDNEEEDLFERLAKIEAKLEYYDIRLEQLEKIIEGDQLEDE